MARRFIHFARRCLLSWRRWAIESRSDSEMMIESDECGTADAGEEWMGEAESLRHDMALPIMRMSESDEGGTADAGEESSWMGDAESLRHDMALPIMHTYMTEHMIYMADDTGGRNPPDPENDAELMGQIQSASRRLQELTGQRMPVMMSLMPGVHVTDDDDDEEAERQQHPALDEIPLHLQE